LDSLEPPAALTPPGRSREQSAPLTDLPPATRLSTTGGQETKKAIAIDYAIAACRSTEIALINFIPKMAEGVRFELTDALQHRRFSVLLWLSPPDDALSV
jgi:hypothetical protein